MPDDRIIEGTAELIEKLGYENLGYNGNTLWFRAGDTVYSVSVIEVDKIKGRREP